MESCGNRRNSTIDILRVLFAVVIALFHIAEVYPLQISNKISLFAQGAIGVEFFSVVTGFLMAQSVKKRLEEKSFEIGKETAYYVGRKYIKIFPYHLFSFVISLFLYLLWNSNSLFDKVRIVFFSFSDLFMLNMTGLYSLKLNVPAWYLSSMFISLLILYPVIRAKYDLFVHVLSPVFVLFCAGWMSLTTESMRGIEMWCGIMYKGTLRVGMGIALGSICFGVCQVIRGKKLTPKVKTVLSILEITGYAVTFLYSCMNLSEQGYFVIFFIIAASITLTFSNVTVTRDINFLRGKAKLENLSLAIFLNQTYCATIIKHIINQYNLKIKNTIIVLIYLFMVFVSSALCLIVVNGVKRKTMRTC